MNTDLLPDSIKIEKKPRRNVTNKMPQPIIYSPSTYGIENRCTGRGIKIAILDSGSPHHKDIKISGDKINLCDENLSASDTNGHSTMISGIINANNKKSIIGIAPHSKLLFGKVIDNNNMCGFNSLVAGVLWSIVKEVDIIVMALGTQYDYLLLKDAIKKAKEHGICIFAAAGDTGINESWDADFPARYDNVFSAGFLKRTKKENDIIKKKIKLYLPNYGLYTTYLDNRYIKVSGSSVSTAFFAGLSAVLIEQYKKENRKDISKQLYSELSRLFK